MLQANHTWSNKIEAFTVFQLFRQRKYHHIRIAIQLFNVLFGLRKKIKKKFD